MTSAPSSIRATAEYKRRVADLREELEEATATADLGRAAQASDEIEAITHEPSAAYGLGVAVLSTASPVTTKNKVS
jgi:hypothetical protein